MGYWSENNKFLVDLFKGRGDNLSGGVRDFAGVILVVGFLLTLGAWQLNWLGNVVNSVLSVLFLVIAASGLLAYPVSRLLHRNEPHLYYQWANFKKEQQ